MTDSVYDLTGVLAAAEYGYDALNRRVLQFFGWREEIVGDYARGYFVPRSSHWVMPDGVRWPGNHLAPAVTQSTDAAKILLNKDWGRTVWNEPRELVRVCIRVGFESVDGSHFIEAIATCIAAVKAHG